MRPCFARGAFEFIPVRGRVESTIGSAGFVFTGAFVANWGGGKLIWSPFGDEDVAGPDDGVSDEAAPSWGGLIGGLSGLGEGGGLGGNSVWDEFSGMDLGSVFNFLGAVWD